MVYISAEGRQKLDAFLDQAAARGKLPGFVFGVSDLEGELYFGARGPRCFEDPSEGPMTPDTLLWICSQTKLIAAASLSPINVSDVHFINFAFLLLQLAVLRLIDTGKLRYDTPVGDYLPHFRNPIIVDKTSTQKTTFRPAKTVVTVKHLLSFSSGLFYPVVRHDLNGLPEGYTSKDMHRAADPVSAFYQIVIGELPALPLKFEPGTNFVYGWNSDVLGFLVERVTGRTLEAFCKEFIFEPVGMTASFYLTPELKKRAASLTYRQEDGSLAPFNNQVAIMEQDPATGE